MTKISMEIRKILDEDEFNKEENNINKIVRTIELNTFFKK